MHTFLALFLLLLLLLQHHPEKQKKKSPSKLSKPEGKLLHKQERKRICFNVKYSNREMFTLKWKLEWKLLSLGNRKIKHTWIGVGEKHIKC